MTNRLAGASQSLLRIVSGLLLFCPGAMKLLGRFGGVLGGAELTALIFTAGLIETVGGEPILLGACTWPVAFVASGEMALALDPRLIR
jgi:uncharacterized membrane protein YphA (DoxX/SURF4 family)